MANTLLILQGLEGIRQCLLAMLRPLSQCDIFVIHTSVSDKQKLYFSSFTIAVVFPTTPPVRPNRITNRSIVFLMNNLLSKIQKMSTDMSGITLFETNCGKRKTVAHDFLFKCRRCCNEYPTCLKNPCSKNSHMLHSCVNL